MLNYFEKGVFQPWDIEKSVVIIKSEKDSGKYYDRFRGDSCFQYLKKNDKVNQLRRKTFMKMIWAENILIHPESKFTKGEYFTVKF